MGVEFLKKTGLFLKEVKKVEQGICPFCDKEVVLSEFRNNTSRQEFMISGLCQKCQDKFFGK